MVESRIDFSSGRNMLISCIRLDHRHDVVLGDNNPAVIDLGFIEFKGLSLATIVGIILNLILPEEKPESK